MKRELFLEGNEICPKLFHAFTILEYEGLPIVFVACDQDSGVYLCDCVESREYRRWVISRTNFDILNSLLSKKIGTYHALEMFGIDKIIVTYDYATEQYSYASTAFNAIGEDDLPEVSSVIRRPLQSAIKELQDLRIELFGHEKKQMSFAPNYSIVFARDTFRPMNSGMKVFISLDHVPTGNIDAA